MKRGDIEIGVQHIVEFPHDEAMMEWGSSKALVRATPLAVAEEDVETRGVGRGRTLKGVRCRLDERLRVIARRHDGGFVELPVGHEFFAESRLVQWPKGKAPASLMLRGRDEQDKSDRERRYVEQDFVRAALAALGCDDDAYALKGHSVSFDRSKLARLLKRTEPAEIARDAILAFEQQAMAYQPWTGLGGLDDATRSGWREAVLEEVRQGLAVSDREIEIPVGPDDFLAGVDVAKADANRPAI